MALVLAAADTTTNSPLSNNEEADLLARSNKKIKKGDGSSKSTTDRDPMEKEYLFL